MVHQVQFEAEEDVHQGARCRSHRELREANRHLHEFLAFLGHELRTPLCALRNALHILEAKGEDAATREWVRKIMDRQTTAITLLVEDMADISRIEHGKVHLCKQPLDLADIIARAIETVRACFEGRGHKLEVRLPAAPVIVGADPGRLMQILTNLLNNAAKYTEAGGQISVTAELQGCKVFVSVRDSGMGIDPEMLPHIFDPFLQLEKSLHRSQGGLGLGLALVRKLAEMHGGTASAYSAGLGQGSEFVVCLPAHAVLENSYV